MSQGGGVASNSIPVKVRLQTVSVLTALDRGPVSLV